MGKQAGHYHLEDAKLICQGNVPKQPSKLTHSQRVKELSDSIKLTKSPQKTTPVIITILLTKPVSKEHEQYNAGRQGADMWPNHSVIEQD